MTKEEAYQDFCKDGFTSKDYPSMQKIWDSAWEACECATWREAIAIIDAHGEKSEKLLLGLRKAQAERGK